MPRFRKRPVEVDAIQWTCDNTAEVKAFVGQRANGEDGFLLPDEITGTWHRPHVWNESQTSWNTVNPGDWIIRGTGGEFYPCEREIFAATYEPVDSDQPTKAALIEIVETDHSTDDGPGVIIPNQVRINGTPLLIPAGEQIKVHSITVNDGERGEDAVCVTLTLFARRVTIAAEGDL
jgi:hypothetical protein